MKIIEGQAIRFHPMAHYTGEERARGWENSHWSVLSSSKDNPRISVQMRQLGKIGTADREARCDEVVYVQDGEIVYSHEGRSFHLHQGDLILINAGDSYTIEVPDHAALLIVYHPPLDSRTPIRGIS